MVDLIGLADEVPFPTDSIVVHDPNREGVTQTINRADISEIEVLHGETHHTEWGGGSARATSSIDAAAQRCRPDDVDRLDVGVRRLVNPHRYHVSVTDRLHLLRRELIEHAKAAPDV